MGLNLNPLSYATEIGKEAWSRLPKTAAYDMRNPNNPHYSEKKTVQIPGRAVTPSEAGFFQTNGARPVLNDGQPTVTDQGTYYGSYGSNGGGGMTEAEKQAQIDYINKAFDVKKAGLQGQLDSLAPQQQAGELRIANQYQNQRNSLERSRATGLGNLDESQRQVQAGRERNLKSIRDQLEQRSMHYANLLGSYGAGDSSATQDVSRILSGNAAENRGEVLRNVSEQETTIANQRRDLENAYVENKNTLDSWKQQSLADLYSQFAQQKNAIMNEMANADVTRQQQLAQYDAALTQSAIDALTNIENMYRQQTADMVSRFQNIFAPQNVQIADNLLQYEVKPISAGTLDGLRMPAPVNPENEVIAALRKREEEQLQNPLGV